jgi:cephalosporin-C deacetylase-like acetyl esterase
VSAPWPFFDLPLEQLQNLQSTVTGPNDFETLWSTTLDVELRRPLEPRIVPLETPLRTLDVYDLLPPSVRGRGPYAPARCAGSPNVPFLCHFRRAVGLTDANPYAEIAQYLAAHPAEEAQAFTTLSYIDGANLGALAQVPALIPCAVVLSVPPTGHPPGANGRGDPRGSRS